MEKLALRKFLPLIDMAFLASSWFHLRKSAFRLFLCALCVSVVNVSFSNSRVLVSGREFSREDLARDFVRRWPIFHSGAGFTAGSSLVQGDSTGATPSDCAGSAPLERCGTHPA
jgi:hypothetical protein